MVAQKATARPATAGASITARCPRANTGPVATARAIVKKAARSPNRITVARHSASSATARKNAASARAPARPATESPRPASTGQSSDPANQLR
jgi:hypothetical protein